MSDVEWAEIDDSVDDWEFAEILEESAHVAANLQEHTAVDDLKHTYANFAADMREAAARIRRLRERTDTGEGEPVVEGWVYGFALAEVQADQSRGVMVYSTIGSNHDESRMVPVSIVRRHQPTDEGRGG